MAQQNDVLDQCSTLCLALSLFDSQDLCSLSLHWAVGLSLPFQISSIFTSPSRVSMVLIRTVFLVCVSTVGSGSGTKGTKGKRIMEWVQQDQDKSPLIRL